MKILTLNAGSNSLKFEFVESSHGSDSLFGSSIVAGAFDDIGKDNATFKLIHPTDARHAEKVEVADHGAATEWLLNWIVQGRGKSHGLGALTDVSRIGHRIVHGGARFEKTTRLTPDVITRIEALRELAPWHTDSALEVIRAVGAHAADDFPTFAVFDTVFHRTIPDEAALYALPGDVAERHGIRRYGFHGVSHQYLLLRYAQITGRSVDETNLITLHLEGGSSAAAIRAGRSIDTSMGFTPLEGLMMGSRCGDIDPAIVLHLMRKEHWDADAAEAFFNKRCGLLGVSGVSADTRELMKHRGERPVDLALDMFAYRVRKYVGAYLAALGGADAIVFGGGIGENTSLVREQVCKPLGWAGVLLDDHRNREAVDREALISTDASPVQIWVIPTQEGLMMAKLIADAE